MPSDVKRNETMRSNLLALHKWTNKSKKNKEQKDQKAKKSNENEKSSNSSMNAFALFDVVLKQETSISSHITA